MKKYLTGAALLSLTVLLVGCGTAPKPTVQTQVVYERPPEILYPDCELPEHTINTNGDLARAYKDVVESLEACRAGLADLRAWPSTDETSSADE